MLVAVVSDRNDSRGSEVRARVGREGLCRAAAEGGQESANEAAACTEKGETLNASISSKFLLPL